MHAITLISKDKSILDSFITWLSNSGEQYHYEDSLYSDEPCIKFTYVDNVIILEKIDDKREQVE